MKNLLNGISSESSRNERSLHARTNANFFQGAWFGFSSAALDEVMSQKIYVSYISIAAEKRVVQDFNLSIHIYQQLPCVGRENRLRQIFCLMPSSDWQFVAIGALVYWLTFRG